MFTHFLPIIILLISAPILAQDPCLPLWPRIQYGGVYSDPTQTQKIVIKFNTRAECPKSYVVVTTKNDTIIRKISCNSTTLTCSQKVNNYKAYIQRCSVQQIDFGSNLTYLPYGLNSTSATAIPFSPDPIPTSIIHPNSTNPAKFIVLADWSQLHQKIGIYKSVNQTMDKIRNDFGVDGIVVNGDFAYDLDSSNGTNYEEFLNLLSRGGRFVPVFLIAGNHQHNSQDDQLLFYGTFENYGADKKFASGLGIGPVFFATFDPFADLYNKTLNLRKQLLSVGPSFSGFTQAMLNGSRTSKLIIPISHYPLKCSAKAQNCQNDVVKLKPYFDLMFEHNINFYIGAHYHTYERLYPYCRNGTFNLVPPPYTSLDLKDCMVSIVEGIAGNDDKIVETYPTVHEYTAKLSFNKTGVGLLTVGNGQINYRHFSSENILTLEDELNITYGNQQSVIEAVE